MPEKNKQIKILLLIHHQSWWCHS